MGLVGPVDRLPVNELAAPVPVRLPLRSSQDRHSFGMDVVIEGVQRYGVKVSESKA
jgi:hypothetical protein